MNAEFPADNGTAALWRPNRQRSGTIQAIVAMVCGVFALISIATTVGIVLTLLFETIGFFQEVSFWNFLTDTHWKPQFEERAEYGIFVLISATVMTSGISLIVSVPLGLLAAICLSEYADDKTRRILKPILEVLAGVPTVVYGYFALFFVTPLLRSFLPFVGPFNALSAGIVLGIMITPLIASLSEDAIFAVPQSLRDGSYALGATKRETILAVVLPAALSGIVSSVILAVSRAIGETMIVALAAGQSPKTINWNLDFVNPFIPIMTMTTFIVQVSLGDTPKGTLESRTIFVVGMTLFVITLALNVFSFWFVRRFREKYE
ncbi:MAG: phosphate ABC transporter permease subunit PstC [Spirulina sp. SIO3F2]|nr:phosphate ABC transporter permease subunit PstC [Spirulina sp. SIO3F2]